MSKTWQDARWHFSSKEQVSRNRVVKYQIIGQAGRSRAAALAEAASLTGARGSGRSRHCRATKHTPLLLSYCLTDFTHWHWLIPRNPTRHAAPMPSLTPLRSHWEEISSQWNHVFSSITEILQIKFCHSYLKKYGLESAWASPRSLQVLYCSVRKENHWNRNHLLKNDIFLFIHLELHLTTYFLLR